MLFRYKLYLLLLITTIYLSAQGQQNYLVEGFDNNNQSWPFIGVGNGYSITIDNGHLIMYGSRTAIHTYQKLPLSEDTNLAIYTRMMFLDGDHTGWMGLRFAMSEQTDKYISFIYNNDKGFMIGVNNGKKYEVIRESKSLVVKPYDYNTLTVIKAGSNYKFLINDKQVHEAKIKNFFGPLVSIFSNSNMKTQVDEFQVYDPQKGRATLADNSIPSSIEMSAQQETTLTNILGANGEAPADFKEFLTNFGQLPSPYSFHPETAQGVEVSHLPFTQKIFYKYVASNVRNKAMWAMGRLGECGNGYALLLMDRYFINNQDISRFIVVAFNPKGELIGEKEIGAMVKESGSFFKVIEFKAYHDGNVVNVEAIETFHNGNKDRKSVRFNTTLCNF